MKWILLVAIIALAVPVRPVRPSMPQSCAPPPKSLQAYLFQKASRQTQEARWQAFADRYLANLRSRLQAAADKLNKIPEK
jgi:valyl-tRNA synthetase